MKIALIDDDKTSLLILAHAIEVEGAHSYEMFHSGASALLDLVEMKPDCVVTDIHMAGLNGLDLIAELKESAYFQDVKFIVITASVENKWQEKARSVGAHGFIKKPVDPEKFVKQINAICQTRSTAPKLKAS